MWTFQQLFHHFASPLCPIIVDHELLRLFSQLVDGMEQHTINTKRWKEAKKTIAHMTDVLDLGRTTLLKANVIRFLDVLIKHSRANRRKIKGLKADMKVLESKYAQLQRDYTKRKNDTPTTNLILDTHSSQQMREATTISFKVS